MKKKDHVHIRTNFNISDLNIANSEHQNCNHTKITTKCQLKNSIPKLYSFCTRTVLTINPRFSCQKCCTHELWDHAQT